MARPLVEFLHAQQLPWQRDTQSYLPSVESKTLSLDPVGGARTLILRFPPGWAAPSPCRLNADEEFYVLDGSLTLNGHSFGLDCYGYYPAGMLREGWGSEHGADVLTFYEDQPVIEAAVSDMTQAPPGTVPFLNTHEMSWSNDGIDPDLEWFGMSWKVLRHDPRTEAATFLLDTPAQRHPPGWAWGQELHHCTEEIFVLSGELLFPYGTMYAGGYLNRPPNIRHGPYYTRFSNVLLARVDGKLENNFGETKQALSLHPEHNVVLPPEAMDCAEAWRPQRY